jgi:hypothetical protein
LDARCWEYPEALPPVFALEDFSARTMEPRRFLLYHDGDKK